MRIVDVLGNIDAWGGLDEAFQKLMHEECAEYIDCLNYGLPEASFARHGFFLRQEENIIPNYFEPFRQENVNIKLAYLNKKSEPYIIFKGDSDQDRPNRRP